MARVLSAVAAAGSRLWGVGSMEEVEVEGGHVWGAHTGGEGFEAGKHDHAEPGALEQWETLVMEVGCSSVCALALVCKTKWCSVSVNCHLLSAMPATSAGLMRLLNQLL